MDRFISGDTTWFSASSPQAWLQPTDLNNKKAKSQKPSKIKKQGSLDLTSELEQLSLFSSSAPVANASAAASVKPPGSPKQKKKQQQQQQQPPQVVVAVVEDPQKPSVTIEDELSKQNLYKTELCRSFSETGSCRYGHKCQFAHGSHELRPVLRHPKYKTEICKTFATTGHCPYGNRCRFIHPQAPKTLDPLSLQSVQWANSWNLQGSTHFATGSVFPFFNTATTTPAIVEEEEAHDEEDEDNAATSRLAIFQELTTH